MEAGLKDVHMWMEEKSMRELCSRRVKKNGLIQGGLTIDMLSGGEVQTVEECMEKFRDVVLL